jgi:hypothetical protein
MSDTSTARLPEPARHFGTPRQKVPPFARYKGTSAWKKNPRGAREYARFRAAASRISQSPATPTP